MDSKVILSKKIELPCLLYSAIEEFLNNLTDAVTAHRIKKNYPFLKPTLYKLDNI